MKMTEIQRTRVVAFAAMTLVLVASGADAADYGTMGQGAQTCTEFTRFYRVSPSTAEHSFFDWAQGFMSGINTGYLGHGDSLKNLASMPVEEQQRLIHEYCDSHPDQTYAQAVTDLYSRLQNRQTQKK